MNKSECCYWVIGCVCGREGERAHKKTGSDLFGDRVRVLQNYITQITL